MNLDERGRNKKKTKLNLGYRNTNKNVFNAPNISLDAETPPMEELGLTRLAPYLT